MLTDAHYIDTRPGRACAFSPPAAVDDYKEWLITRHKNSADNGDGYCYGVAQKINIIMQQQKKTETPAEVMTHGPYAGPAAEALQEISNGALDATALG